MILGGVHEEYWAEVEVLRLEVGLDFEDRKEEPQGWPRAPPSGSLQMTSTSPSSFAIAFIFENHRIGSLRPDAQRRV